MKHHLCPPELKLTIILIGLAIFLCGCSSSHSVGSTAVRGAYTYGEMNEELKGRHVTIELRDGRDISAKEVKISDDSVSWVYLWTDEESKASILQLDKIVVKNHFQGSLDGLRIGLFCGMTLGTLVGEVLYPHLRGSSTISGAGIGLILGGGTGIVVGLTTGLIVGHSYNFEFPMTEQSDSSHHGK